MRWMQKITSFFGVLSAIVLLSMSSAAQVNAQDATEPGTIENTWQIDAYIAAQMDAVPSGPNAKVILVAQQRFDQIHDRSELAEYLATLPDSPPAANPAIVRVAILNADTFDAIMERQEVARYHAGLFDAPLPADGPQICIAVTTTPIYEQIDNRMQLAYYQAHMADIWLPVKGESLRIVVLPHRNFERIVRQQQLAVQEAEIMDGPLLESRRLAVIAPGMLN